MRRPFGFPQLSLLVACATCGEGLSSGMESLFFGEQVTSIEFVSRGVAGGNLSASMSSTGVLGELIVEGMPSMLASLRVDPVSVRERKPRFEAQILTGDRLTNSRTFTLSAGDPSYLNEFAISTLGQLVDVPTPRVSHVTLTLDGRELGLYALTEPGECRVSGAVFKTNSGDIPDLLASGGLDSSTSNVLANVVKGCVLRDLEKRCSLLELGLDLDAFHRFLAFETLMGDGSGYGDTGLTFALLVNTNARQLRFVAPLSRHAFAHTGFPIAVRKRGYVARAVLETRVGRVAMFEALAAMTTREMEERVLAAIDRRAQLIQPLVAIPSELRRWDATRRTLKRRVMARFADVRQQLARYPKGFPDMEEAAILRKGPADYSSSLPVTNSINFGARFAALMESDGPLETSIPAPLKRIEIFAPTGNVEQLSWKDTRWVTVGITFEGVTLTNVGLRLKGHATRQGFDRKPSFTLKYNHLTKGQKLDGQTKHHFHNATYDPSFLHQFTGAWLFQRAGLPVARIEYAEVFVNGRPYGLFVVAEGITKTFLKREFGSAEGLLFEGSMADVGDVLDLDNGEIPADYSGLQQCFNAAATAASSGALGSLTNHCAVRAFASFLATEVTLGHRDGYAISRNNYRIYQVSPHHPFIFIPHGMDLLRLQLQGGVFPPMEGIVARALLAAPGGRTLYLGELENVLNLLDLDVLTRDCAAVSKLIQPTLERFEPEMADRQWNAAKEHLRLFGDRLAYLRRELALQKQYGPDSQEKTLAAHQP